MKTTEDTTVTAPKAALETALIAARMAEPIATFADGRAFAILPPGFTASEIKDPYRLPPYPHASVALDDAESLMRYTTRFSDARSILLANFEVLQIVAHLDWHAANHADGAPGDGAPGPCKHQATVTLLDSEEFIRWSKMEGELHDQMVFAEFLDENASDIIDPDPAVFLEVARDLEATQGVTFKSGTRLQTGERNLTWESETHVKGEMKVPTQFTLSIPLFRGEEPVPVTASFRFRPTAKGLLLGFVWRRVEYRRQAEFAAIAHRVAERTGLPVMFGRD